MHFVNIYCYYPKTDFFGYFRIVLDLVRFVGMVGKTVNFKLIFVSHVKSDFCVLYIPLERYQNSLKLLFSSFFENLSRNRVKIVICSNNIFCCENSGRILWENHIKFIFIRFLEHYISWKILKCSKTFVLLSFCEFGH